MDYAKEIIELHQFFQDWFTGAVENTEAAFSRCVNVLDPAFVLIGPDGLAMDYPALIQLLRKGYNARPDVKIWIKNPVLRHETGDILIATYEEWQADQARGETRRLSTVVFQKQADRPNGLLWLHVHETWLP